MDLEQQYPPSVNKGEIAHKVEGLYLQKLEILRFARELIERISSLSGLSEPRFRKS